MFDSEAVEKLSPGPELAQALLAVETAELGRAELAVWAAASQRLEAHLEAHRYGVLASFAEASPVEPPPMPGVPGADSAVSPGGEGTPEVSCFAETDLAAAMGCSTGRAHGLLGDGLDLRHRMPRLLDRLERGLVGAFKVRMILREARALPLVSARALDAEVAPVAATVGPKRLGRLVEQILQRLDPDAAEARAAGSKASRRVHTGEDRDGCRQLFGYVDAIDGLHFDAALDRVADILGDLGDPEPREARRATAVGWLANPPAVQALVEHHRAWRRGETPQPWAQIVLPDLPLPDDSATGNCATYAGGDPGDGDLLGGDLLGGCEPDQREYAVAAAATAAGTDAEGFAHADAAGQVPSGTPPHLRAGLWPTDVPTPSDRIAKDLWPAATVVVHMDHQAWVTGTGGVDVDGHGPITAAQAFDRLRHHRITIKPVIDLNDDLAWTAPQGSDFTGGLREAVLLAHPWNPFPYADAPSKNVDDFDHTIPREDGGTTALPNGAPLRRRLHRVKTFAKGWRVRQPFTGITVWQSPQQRIYICDRRGQTHDLGTRHTAETADAKRRRRP